jgi:HEAT repeat protein
LWAAIPQLPAPFRDKAREALVERMTRMKAKTLKDKFTEDDPEVRRAAAMACARKLETGLIPDLINLLQDPEPLVVDGARQALKGLTAQDFGPEAGANREQRTLARAAWFGWWLNQKVNEKKPAK